MLVIIYIDLFCSYTVVLLTKLPRLIFARGQTQRPFVFLLKRRFPMKDGKWMINYQAKCKAECLLLRKIESQIYTGACNKCALGRIDFCDNTAYSALLNQIYFQDSTRAFHVSPFLLYCELLFRSFVPGNKVNFKLVTVKW